jgi:N,N'-diacetyllegionaminate synthase
MCNEHSNVFIIAEAGVNHNGDIKIAKKLIDSAVYTGADAVKFQTFHAEDLVTPDCKTAAHQKRSGKNNQFDLLKSQEFSFDEFSELKDYCDKKKIEFISTPYDVKSVELLDKLNVKRFKIASAELVNKPVIKAIAKTKKPVILATGMANLGEIEQTINLIRSYYSSNITLLHCTTSYPTPYDQVNMNVISTLKNAFNLPVGYSDHTVGIEIAVMAVSLGAVVIEKHFTLDKKMIGPDHFASAEPEEFKQMVRAIRNVERAFGKKEKTLTEEEKKNIHFMRRSIHSVKDIKKGEQIKADDIKMLRENDGLSPWLMELVIGREARRDIKKNKPITWDDI